MPAGSVAVAVMVWVPGARVAEMVKVPFVAGPLAPEMALPASFSVTVAPASAEPVTTTDVTFVVPSVADVPVSVAAVRASPAGADGAVVSITMIWVVKRLEPCRSGRVSVAAFPATSLIVPASADFDL